jgi:nucleoid-associated protein YgaU
VERGSKIATAAGVFMAGLAVAMLFRHDGSRIGAAPPEDFNHLVLRGRMDLDAPIAPATTSSSTETVDSSSAGSLVSATSKTGGGSNKASAPGTSSSSASSPPYTWPLPKPPAPAVPAAPPKPLRRHRITDGDTLASLADRYLDSADRASEIYELNREVLPGPGLLPIGTEIKLPARDAPRDATRTSANTNPPLVPLPPRS